MSRLFDPSSLLDSALDANETRRDPLPAGECVAQVVDISFADGISKKTGQPWNRLDAKLTIDDPSYLRDIPGNNGQSVTTTLGIMLDLTDSGGIATGPNKNIRLGRFREACGVNGKPLSSLVGQRVRISIGHKPHPTDLEVVLDEILGYTKP
jgi:hypothetical protein